jgi:hypothetical protein
VRIQPAVPTVIIATPTQSTTQSTVLIFVPSEVGDATSG